jgi:hypothetical protein
VQEIEFRQARQLKPNLYLKVDDLHLAKLIMSGWSYNLIEKTKVERHILSACILAIPLLPAGLPSETAKLVIIGFIFLLLISMQSLIERLCAG